MTVFTFDTKLFATCRVSAATAKEARAKLRDILDGIDLAIDLDGVQMRVVSLDDNGPDLIERDGIDVTDECPL